MSDARGTGATRRVGVGQLRTRWPRLLREVAQGSSFLITSDDRVLAEVRPVAPAVPRRPRVPGSMRGQIRMAPDLDELPEEVLRAMEGEDG